MIIKDLILFNKEIEPNWIKEKQIRETLEAVGETLPEESIKELVGGMADAEYKLKKYDVPTTYKIEDIEDFYEHFFLDKKSSDSKIKFILPVGIGDCRITDEIKKEDVCEILKGF